MLKLAAGLMVEAGRPGGKAPSPLRAVRLPPQGGRLRTEAGQGPRGVSGQAVSPAPAAHRSWGFEKLTTLEHLAQGSYQEVEKEQEGCQLRVRVPKWRPGEELFGWSRIGAFPKQAGAAYLPGGLPPRP